VTFSVDAVFFENGFSTGGGLKNAGYDGFVGTVTDHVGRGFAAHQQREGVDEDRLSRAGFAREQVKARAEDGDGVINDGIIFSAQLDEHPWVTLSRLYLVLAQQKLNGITSAA